MSSKEFKLFELARTAVQIVTLAVTVVSTVAVFYAKLESRLAVIETRLDLIQPVNHIARQ